MVQNIHTKKLLIHRSSLVNHSKILGEKIILIIYKLFQKSEEFSNLFFEACIATQTTQRHSKNKKETQTNFPHEYRFKNSKQNFIKSNPTIYKKDNIGWG